MYGLEDILWDKKIKTNKTAIILCLTCPNQAGPAETFCCVSLYMGEPSEEAGSYIFANFEVFFFWILL